MEDRNDRYQRHGVYIQSWVAQVLSHGRFSEYMYIRWGWPIECYLGMYVEVKNCMYVYERNNLYDSFYSDIAQ